MKRFSVPVKVGEVCIGGGGKITVQSMLNKPSSDIQGNINQAVELYNEGCDIIRVSVPDMESVKIIGALKDAVPIPVVADIHFDYRLAIESVYAGADKVRINPGNIGETWRVGEVVKICSLKGTAIRVGVNSGSVGREILAKHGGPTAEALCESALKNVEIIEGLGFDKIVLSMKSSSVQTTVKAYELAAKSCNYPLHLGVTEAGTLNSGRIKSCVGIGSLLLSGIGDTIRVSLTANPVHEVRVGVDILKALGFYHNPGAEIISCPTCGRTKIDIIGIAGEVEERLRLCNKQIKVAIMGCVVNGPGEAREADIGIAGGDGVGVIFKKGEIIKKVPECMLVEELMKEIDDIFVRY